MTDMIEAQATENSAETMRRVMEQLNHHGDITTPDNVGVTKAHLVTVPKGREVVDLSKYHRDALEHLKPTRRKGTARLDTLESLIDWATRFMGETTVLFAKPDMSAPSLTCIADYHAAGAVDVENDRGDPTARHCHHRAVYNFPLSDEWNAWMKVSGQPLDKDDLGEFIEANAKDIMDPTPAILEREENSKNQDFENRLIRTAQKIEGRYGQLGQLLAMSKQFQVHETSNLSVTTNRDTGETSIQFVNEHKTPDGKPLSIPNLIIIAIPVFLNGPLYRMPVRFRYRKQGGQVKFILSVYNPEKAFEASFKESLDLAAKETGLTLFQGTPEN